MIIEYKKKDNKIIEKVSDDFNKDDKNLGVVVDVLYCGICGTDYQKYIGMNDVEEWGHEIIGKVINGSNDIVTIRTTYPCEKCDNCLSGHNERCMNFNRLNFNGFSNKILVNSNSLIHLDELDIVYALVEPLYVAKSLIKHINPEKDSIYAIIGNGTIGLLTAFLIKNKYNSEVRIVGRRNLKSRKKFTDKIDAKYYFIDNMDDALKGSSKIVITTPYNSIPNVLQNTDSYSSITFNGISKETIIELEMDKWHFKNLNIWPSFPHPQSDFSEEIKIIKENKKLLRNIITDIYELDNIEDAFKKLNDKKQDSIKILIKCNGVSK